MSEIPVHVYRTVQLGVDPMFGKPLASFSGRLYIPWTLDVGTGVIAYGSSPDLILLPGETAIPQAEAFRDNPEICRTVGLDRDLARMTLTHLIQLQAAMDLAKAEAASRGIEDATKLYGSIKGLLLTQVRLQVQQDRMSLAEALGI